MNDQRKAEIQSIAADLARTQSELVEALQAEEEENSELEDGTPEHDESDAAVLAIEQTIETLEVAGNILASVE